MPETHGITRALGAGALALALGPAAPAQEFWTVRLELDDPSLRPQVVQVALIDRDPLAAFATRTGRMADLLARRLADAADDVQRRARRISHVTAAWDRGFRQVTGDQLHLLVGGEDGVTLTSSTRAGRRWLVSKVRTVDDAPACWCVPFEADPEQEARVSLTAANRIDLLELHDAPPDEVEQREPAHDRPSILPAGWLADVDVARLRELHRITDELGDELWPGFDTRQVPIAVNFDDRRELLVGHPDPPPEYMGVAGHQIDGQPVLMREGVSRFGPQGGGWAVDLAGARTVYVGPAGEQGPIERYLLLLLHEAFHVYQARYRPRGGGGWEEPPEDDPEYSAMIGLESRVLSAALASHDPEQVRALARTFVAVRQARRAGRSEDLARAENEQEFNEGTATYSQVRALELLVAAGGLAGSELEEPRYRAFAEARPQLDEFLAGILPNEEDVITFFHSQYQHGMAQCLLLDRVRPGWKEEMRAPGISQFPLLEREFELGEEERAALVAAARERFGYAPLLARQGQHVQARIDEILAHVAGPGRRYRVHHGMLSGSFRWKPEGPVLHVTPQLLGEEGSEPRATLWVGGIRRFERGDLLFESGAVPVLFRPTYLEWIDRDPDPDGADLVLRSEREEDGVHHGLVLETDGFTLSVGRARVEVGEGVVDVLPLDERRR